MAGGKPGHASRFVIRHGSSDAEETPASGRYALRAGECFMLETAGGGGYGDPLARTDAAIATDLAEGYVTDAAIAADYTAIRRP